MDSALGKEKDIFEKSNLADEARIGKTAEVASFAAMGASGAGAAAAMRLAVVAGGCNGEIPRMMNPTGLTIDGSDAAGAVVGNTAIALGFGLLCFLLLKVAQAGGHKVFPRLFDNLDTQGFLRMPSVPLCIFQFLYQGLTLSGMTLVLHPAAGWHLFLGLIVIMSCIAIPCILIRVVRKNVPAMGVYAKAVNRHWLLTHFIGPGEWVNTTQDSMWVQRYATVLRTYKQERVWYVGVDFAASFALSAIQSVVADSNKGCGHIKFAGALVFLALLALEVTFWQHARSRDGAADITALSMQSGALMCMAVGYYYDDPEYWTFTAASVLFLVAVGVLMLKVVADILTELYILVTQRRTNLQDDILSQRQAKLISETSLSECTEHLTLDIDGPTPAATTPLLEPRSGHGRGGLQAEFSVEGGSFSNACVLSPCVSEGNVNVLGRGSRRSFRSSVVSPTPSDVQMMELTANAGVTTPQSAGERNDSFNNLMVGLMELRGQRPVSPSRRRALTASSVKKV